RRAEISLGAKTSVLGLFAAVSMPLNNRPKSDFAIHRKVKSLKYLREWIRMTKAIRVHANGGPEVLEFQAVELPPPGPGEVRVRATAIGVNFIDVYHRTGLYPQPLPFTLGKEG